MRLLYDWGASGGLLLALTSGNREYLEDGLKIAFRDAGLSHILALSGMHLSIIGGIALGLAAGTAGRRLAVRFSLIVVSLFVWFAGNSPSLDRSLIMVFTAAFLRSRGIRINLFSLLALSAIIQLVLSPEDSQSLAFKLSYASLTGIVLVGTWVTYCLEPWIPSRILSGFGASFGAQLFTAPVAAGTVAVLAPIGILAACVMTPLVTLYLVSGIILIMLATIIPGLVTCCLPLYGKIYDAVCSLAFFFSAFPKIAIQDLFALITVSILSAVCSILLYAVYTRTRLRRAPDALFAGL